jgi:hypothetical protein
MKQIMMIALAVFGLATAASGEVMVKTEQLNPADPAWKFKTIPGPSKSDIAEGMKVTLVGNHSPASFLLQ